MKSIHSFRVSAIAAALVIATPAHPCNGIGHEGQPFCAAENGPCRETGAEL